MIDNFALAVSHGLMMLGLWVLLRRPDLDSEAPPPADQDSGRDERKPGERPGA